MPILWVEMHNEEENVSGDVKELSYCLVDMKMKMIEELCDICH